MEAVAGWFSGSNAWRPKVLNNQAPESAVAIGAAYYGRVRRGGGLRIRAGSARTYYIGVQSDPDAPQAVCVLPAGIEEGTTLPLANREFAVLTNRPVSFTLYSSTTRHDAHGEVAVFDEEQIHRHAPLVTLLRFGKKSRQIELGVQLNASFTEVGTLELWCESLKTQHRWRLQFELRGDEAQTAEAPATPRRRLPHPHTGDAGGRRETDSGVFGPAHEVRGQDARATAGGRLRHNRKHREQTRGHPRPQQGLLAHGHHPQALRRARGSCRTDAPRAGGTKLAGSTCLAFACGPVSAPCWTIGGSTRREGSTWPGWPFPTILNARWNGWCFGAAWQADLTPVSSTSFIRSTEPLLGTGGKKTERPPEQPGGARRLAPAGEPGTPPRVRCALRWARSCWPESRRNPPTRLGCGRSAGWARASHCMAR